LRVVFLEDVEGVAQGGDVKDVKNGFARNYLIPKNLAVLATRDALKRVQRLTEKAEDSRLKTLVDMKALAEELEGKRVDVEMRAGASGRLYGSVTNAVVAAQLSSMTDREIDRRTIEVTEPIRQTGAFDLRIRLHAEVDAHITALVYPAGADPEEFLADLREAEEAAAAEAEEQAAQAAEAPSDVADVADEGPGVDPAPAKAEAEQTDEAADTTMAEESDEAAEAADAPSDVPDVPDDGPSVDAGQAKAEAEQTDEAVETAVTEEPDEAAESSETPSDGPNVADDGPGADAGPAEAEADSDK
jgi:large subunit ribosomal protein L9